MRVLYFSQDYTPHDHRFLHALAGTEHHVAYLRLQDAGRMLEARPIPAGVELIDWWGGRRPVAPDEYRRAADELRGVVDQYHPDLVHAGPIQHSAFIAAEAGLHPLVAMSWGSDLLRDAQAGEGRAIAAGVLEHSEALACDCRAVRDAAEQLGMPPSRIVVFPWGVDLGHFNPVGGARLRSQLGWEHQLVVLSTRSWEQPLGVDQLVQGFIGAAGDCERLRLILLGSGPLERSIRKSIDQANLGDRVHFAGQQGYDNLPDIYRSADLYLSASHSDGSSVSLLEAMACALPALVSDIPGNAEWVEDGVNGWRFADGEVPALEAGLRRACRQPGELAGMGRAARATAEQRADWSRNFPRLLDAYQTALLKARRS